MSKNKIRRAGVIPYYIDDENNIQMLFMRPSDEKYGGFVFQISKGKIEEGETPLEAALREGREEIGLFSKNVEGECHHLGTFLGRTDIYVCKVKDPDMFGDPSTPEEVESTKWMTLNDFDKDGRDLHKPIIKAAVRYIQKTNKEDI